MKQERTLNVGLRDLRFETIIGIHPHERRTAQPVSVSLGVEVDPGALATDKMDQTVNYSDFARIIREEAARAPELLEKLAVDILTKIFELDPRVLAAEVEIRKTRAVKDAACSFVRLRERRAKPAKTTRTKKTPPKSEG